MNEARALTHACTHEYRRKCFTKEEEEENERKKNDTKNAKFI